MAEGGSERTVLIKIKDHDPLNVCATRLTADSSVFRRLIDELGLTEIEIEDFEPEIVTLFITLLEDRTLHQIEDSQFRGLHKISAAFKICWLVKYCRNWLCSKIQHFSLPPDRNLLLFLFEECLFIIKKWDFKRPMNLLVSKLVRSENRDFILRYIEDSNDMNAADLEYLLKLAGTDHTIFLEVINKELENTQSLSENLRYLLENINFNQLSLIRERRGIIKRVSDLPSLTLSDLKFLLQIQERFDDRVEERSASDDLFSTGIRLPSGNITIRSLRNLLQFVQHHKDEGSPIYIMNVVDLLAVVVSPDGPPPTEADRKEFFEILENMAREGNVRLVPAEYVDMIISVLKRSPTQNKGYFIELLEAIRENESLASYFLFVELSEFDPPLFVRFALSLAMALLMPSLEDFVSYKIPSGILPECNRDGSCGFITYRNRYFKLDFVYRYLEMHYHDYFTAQDMRSYRLARVEMENGEVLSLPVSVGIPVKRYVSEWKRWLPGSMYMPGYKDYLYYCIKNFLVFRHRNEN